MTEYAKLVVSVDSTQAASASKSLDQLTKTSRTAEKGIDSLAGAARSLAAPLAAFLSVRAVINASDQYGQMASRIRQATSSAEEYTKVQDRLLQTANATYRPLAEAQEVYIRTADAIRSLGYDTDAALDITDSFSFLLVTNAASADRASSAINAYSKAIQTGKLDSDGWQSILAATPTIVDDIAAATGRSTAEIRKLGIDGKLSVQALNEALRQSRGRNEELAAAMETSVADATTALSNSFQVFIGKVNEASGASGILTESIGDIAETLQDAETIKAAQDFAGGIVTAFNDIIGVARVTVRIVNWAAESLAASLHGAALDDIVRVEDEIASTQRRLADLQKELDRPRVFRVNPFASTDELEADYQTLQQRLNVLKQAQQDFYRGNNPNNGPPGISDRSAASSSSPVQAAAKDTKAAEAAAKKLAGSYKSMEEGLSRQVALYGQSTEIARVNFELQNGSLEGIVGKQAQHLRDLAKELDAKRDLTAQEQLRIDILRESGQLAAASNAQFQLEYAEKIAEYERQGNKEALARLETLRRIREVQINADLKTGTVEGVTKAPATTGLDALIGGPSSEILKLQQQSKELEVWRNTELEKQRAFLEAKAINEEQYSERLRNIEDQSRAETAKIEAARQQVMLSSAASLFGELTSLSKQFAGDQSGIYKAMFMVQKAFAIAQSVIAIQQGLALAAANPWPMNLGAMASVAAATAGIVSNIAAVGMAHDGIDSVPREGTWLLDKGERVVDRRTNADLKEFLAKGGSGGQAFMSSAAPIHQTFEINGDVSQETIALVQRAMREALLAVQKDANQNGPIMQTIRRRM